MPKWGFLWNCVEWVMRVVACLVIAFVLACSAQSLAEVFDQAAVALSQGNYEAAENGFSRVLESQPNHVDTLCNLGLVYARTGRLDQAIETYRKALGVNPHHPGALLNLGLAYMKKGAFREALEDIRILAADNPASPPARDIHLLYTLSDGFLRQDRSADAHRRLEEFFAALSPAAASLVRCKFFNTGERFEDAADACRRALAADPKLRGARLELARALLGLHSNDAAAELDAALQEPTTDPEDLYNIGTALLQVDRISDGVRFLERARDGDPSFWGTYYQLGKLKLQAGQPAQAVPLLRKAAELNSTAFSVYYELGRALTAAGQAQEGARAMDRARELMAQDLSEEAKALRKK